MSERPSAAAGLQRRALVGVAFGRYVPAVLLSLLAFSCIPLQPAAAQAPPALGPPAAEPPAAQPGEDASAAATGPTYWARDFSFSSVSIATVISRLRWLGVDVPVDAEGTVSVDATIWIPFGALANPTAYRLEGTLTSRRLRIESVVLSNLEVGVRLNEGVLEITRATGSAFDPQVNAPAGQLVAQGSAQLIPPGPLRFTLQLQQVDLPYVLQRVDAGDLEMSGQVSGQVRLENQLRTAAQWPQWSGGGQVRIEGFRWQDRPAIEIVAESFRVQQGRITSDQLAITNPRLRLAGSGAVDTTAAGSYRINVAGDSVPLEQLIPWAVGGDPPPQTSGSLAVSLAIAGGLEPFSWQAEGTVQGPQARLAGLQLGALAHRLEIGSDRFELQLLPDAAEPLAQSARIRSLAARYEVADDAWRLSELQGQLLGGAIGGSAVWPTGDQGTHQADLNWSGLAFDFQFDNPQGSATRLHVETSGDLQWSVPAGQLHRPAAHQLDASVQLRNVAMNDQPIGRLDARANAENANWQASAEGSLFDGGADLQLTTRVPADAQWQDVVRLTAEPTSDAAANDAAANAAGEGSYRLQIDGAAIPLAALLAGRKDAAGDDDPLQLDVVVSGGMFPFSVRAEGEVRSGVMDPAGLVLGPLAHRFSIDQRRLHLAMLPDADRAVVIESLEAEYAILPDAVRLNELEGRLWGGQIAGSAVWITGQQGQHQAELKWSELAIDYHFDTADSQPMRLHADTSGSVQWSAPVDQLDRPAAHQLSATAQLHGVTFGGRPLGQLAATADAVNAHWQVSAQGTLLGGDADVQLAAQVPADAQWQDLLQPMAQPPGQREPVDATRPGGTYRLQIDGAAIPLNEILGASPQEDATPLLLDVGVSGGLFPFDFHALGTARSGPIDVAGVALGSLAHRFSVQSQRLRVEALADAPPTVALRSLQADYAIQPDAVRLSRLEGQLWDGRISGSLTWMTEAAGQHQAQLQWRNLTVDGRFPPAAETSRRVRLTTSGELAWSAAAVALQHPAAHRLEASVALDRLTVDGAAAGNLQLSLRAQQQQWAATGRAVLLGQPVTLQGEATVPTTATWNQLFGGVEEDVVAPAVPDGGRVAAGADDGGGRYALQLQTFAFPVDTAVALLGNRDAPPDVELTLDLELLVAGALSPLTWQIGGTARSAETVIAGLELGPLAHRFTLESHALRLQPLPDAPASSAVGTLVAEYQRTANHWQVRRLEGQLWGGQLSGSGRWIRVGDGRHEAQLRWSDLMVRGRWAMVGDDPSRLSAATSGDLQWSAPAASLASPAAHQLEASLRVDPLTIDAVPIGAVDAQVTAKDGQWTLAGDGELLGGPAAIQLRATVPETAGWQQIADQTTDGSLAVAGQLDVGPVLASRLFALWQSPAEAQRWRGRVQLNWQLEEVDPASPRTSRLAITADALQYGQQPLTDRLTAQLIMIGDEIIVQSVSGSYAGGRIGATGRWGLGSSASQLAIQLTAIDASRAVLPFSPELGQTLAGRVSGRLAVSGGETLKVGGSLEMRGGSVSGVPAENLRTTVAATVALPAGRWRLQMRDVHGRIARGRLRGNLTLESSAGSSDRFDLDSRWEMDGIDFEKLLDQLGGSNRTLGRGVLTGTLSLSGRRIRSVGDLRGELRASLAGSDATAFPGLPAAQNYLGAFSLRNTRFDAGSIYGRISHGEFQIRELWLVGDQLRVWGEGEVALASGRIDLDMVAATGNFEQANPGLLLLAQQFALDAALPVTVVLRANELLSDRVIRLQLYGTYRRPQVRINPVRNLGQNAARFFLRSLAGDLVPSGAAAAAANADR